MKKSVYNKILTTNDGKKIAFNSMTCALAEVDESFFKIYDNIENLNYENLDDQQKKLINNMLKGNYIINDEIDELKIIKYRHFHSKFTEDILSLTIAPTLECNFACPYCYETPKKGLMNKEVQNAIIDVIKKRIKKIKKLSVFWYGGEPLLAQNIILSLSNKIIKICEENKIEYTSFMVTNGYLLNDELIDKLKICKITSYQITIDGPPEIHNQRRKFKGYNCDTYTKLINNIKLLLTKDLEPIIRVNIDSTNAKYVDDLLNLLLLEGLSKVTIYFGHVRGEEYSGCNLHTSCMNCQEYAEFDFKYSKILHNKGFSLDSDFYPTLKSNYCGADNCNAFVIDHEGNMYKCWNDVGIENLAIANVLTEEKVDDLKYMNNINYLMWTPFDYKECKECWLLPICMGGCPWNGMHKGSKPECEKWKYVIEKSMIEKYNVYKSSGEKNLE
ncbi:MAG: SPASM domain-containing protein [Lachnospiraceae bacterium]|nr:SPASM domain-containing protein [Lachnospiraceae bacterium]